MLSKDQQQELSKQIGYEFKRRDLLVNALTHSSYVNENGLAYYCNNERLEFLGDSVLDAVISEYLYEKYAEKEEGMLTKERASIVCESSLASCGVKFHLGEYLILGRGEDHNGGRTRNSMLADAVEALIGAVYLDGGWENAKAVSLRMLADVIRDASIGNLGKDYKSLIQERFQAEGETAIRYVVVREEGPDHDKTFFVELRVHDKVVGKGRGKSKKEAEQRAAQAAYEHKS